MKLSLLFLLATLLMSFNSHACTSPLQVGEIADPACPVEETTSTVRPLVLLADAVSGTSAPEMKNLAEGMEPTAKPIATKK